MDKIFVITDERCGGTAFGKLFETLGFTIIDDPQTSRKSKNGNEKIHNKKYVMENLSFFYENHDYVKICMVSFTVDEYMLLINQAITIGCKIIFLWRANYLERAISRTIAEETGVWFARQKNSRFEKRFNLSVDRVRHHLFDNKKKVEKIKQFLANEKIPHTPIMYENIFNVKLNASQRVESFLRILCFIFPEIVVTESEMHIMGMILSPSKKLNGETVYRRISNLGSIRRSLGKPENGII